MYLNTLSGVELFTTHSDVTVGHDVRGALVAAVQQKLDAAFWLPEVRLAAPVYL